MDFNGKVIMVTGGSSGIGASAAVKFVEQGANVVIIGRNQKKLNNVSQICEKNGTKPLVIVADVTEDNDAKRIVLRTIETFGKLDVLVNNAGACCFESILSQNAMESFDRMITLNLRAAVNMTNLASPYLIETKGNIVNVSSAAILAPINFSYYTSKTALDNFTKSIALELAKKRVRVNAVKPGMVKTDFLEYLLPNKEDQSKFWDKVIKNTPLGKASDPNEIADMILYLASEKARSITGSSFVIDNGLLLTNALSNITE